MKQVLVLIIILFACKISFAQAEFAPIGAEWYYTYQEGVGTPAMGYYLLKSIKDTTIDSKECKILSRTLVNSNGILFNDGQSIVYKDYNENKIFRYLYDNFYLLFDFTKTAGDTIVIIEPLSASKYDSITIVIDSIGFETFSDNIQLKSFFTHQINQFKFHFSGKFIENIGNVYFLFPNNELDCDGGCPQPLRCYNDSQIGFISHEPDILQVPCDFVYTDSYLKKDEGEINVFPNPFTNSFTIRNNAVDGILSIDILNFYGQIVLQDIIPEKLNLNINLHEYPNGLYYLRIKNKGKSAIYKLIKESYLP